VQNAISRRTRGFDPGEHVQPLAWCGRLACVLGWPHQLYEIDEAQAELRKRQAKLEEESRKIEQAVESDFASLQSATLRITAAENEQRAALAVAEAVQTQLAVRPHGQPARSTGFLRPPVCFAQPPIQALKEQYAAQSRLLGRIGCCCRAWPWPRPGLAQAEPNCEPDREPFF